MNDSASTVVGKPVTFNVLENDTDPDNDPLTVAGLPQLVSSNGQPERTRGDLAQRRRRVLLPADRRRRLRVPLRDHRRQRARRRVHPRPCREPTENRPPTAVRDDVTISRGDTRNVYVLENDTDPDGDVVGIRRLDGRRRASRSSRCSASRSGSPCSPDAPEQSQFTLHDLRRRAASPSTGTSSSPSATPTRPTSHRSRVPTRSRCGPVGRRPPACWSTTTTPRAARLRVVGVSPVPGADLRIGPGGQEIFVSVDAGDRLVVLVRLRRRRRGRQPERQSLVQVRLVPDGDGEPAAGRPARRGPHGRPAARSTSPCSPTTPTPTATRSRVEIDHRPADVRHRHRRSPTAAIRYAAAARRERVRPAALHDRRRQRRPCGRRGRDRRAAGRRREPSADRHQRHLHRDRRRRHPVCSTCSPTTPTPTATRCRSPTSTPAPTPSPSIRRATSASSRRSRSTAPGPRRCRSPTRSPTAGAAPTRRSSRSRSSSRRYRMAPIAVDDIAGPVARRQGPSTVDVLANDSDPDGRVAELTVRRRPIPLLPIAADRHRHDHRPPGDDPARLHDHRSRRPDGHGRGDGDRPRQRRDRPSLRSPSRRRSNTPIDDRHHAAGRRRRRRRPLLRLLRRRPRRHGRDRRAQRPA